MYIKTKMSLKYENDISVNMHGVTSRNSDSLDKSTVSEKNICSQKKINKANFLIRLLLHIGMLVISMYYKIYYTFLNNLFIPLYKCIN